MANNGKSMATSNISYPCPCCKESIEILHTTNKDDLRCPWCRTRLRLEEDIDPCHDDSKLVTFSSNWDE
jgi:DNA-directed RNA polymerase subunit RPC12/RpoP